MYVCIYFGIKFAQFFAFHSLETINTIMTDTPHDTDNQPVSKSEVELEKAKPIEDVCDDMLKKVFDYFNGELTGLFSYQ